jgi:hypothetical protein
MSTINAVAATPVGSQVPIPADDGPDKFVKFLQNNDELQVVATLSNVAGVLGAPAAILGLISIFKSGQPDNSEILSAITQLQATLQSDFESMGDLITQQAQLTRDTINRDTMAVALSNSGLAANAIQNFLSSGRSDDLETAKNYSTLGFEYFTSLNLTSAADLAFFMPGLIKAGTIRLFVLASEPLSARETQSVFIGDISSMVALLTSMVNSLQSTTDANHIVTTKHHTVKCSAIPQVVEASAVPSLPPPHSRTVTVIDGYSHVERVVATDGSGNVSLTPIAFFDAQQGNPQCEQPSGLEHSALAAAEQDRSLGVTQELAYIGYPYFQQVLQAWTTFLTAATTPPITTVLDLNGTWITGGAPGPVITVNGNAISIDLSVYKRPSAFGSIVDGSDITVTFPDADTYTAVLQPPGTIQWSNDTSWTKVTSPITTVLDLNGTWITGGAPGPVITVNGNAISIDLSVYKRPSAFGSVIDGSDITVTFPDADTYTAVLQAPGTIQWSNNTSWTKATS